jgi:hypothetical protein
MKFLSLLLVLLFSISAFSKDVNVSGYYRTNGTYVAPYVRSAPDSSRANNYGTRTSTSSGLYDRDRDNDGVMNQYDSDDDNDGVLDDNE